MKKIAILFTGHIRTFNQCYDNIHSNLISPLKELGFSIDFYLSLWNTLGHRMQDWSGVADFNNIMHLLDPTNTNIEKFDREYFLRNYNTDRWQTYPHLSNHTTFPDSVSMWYKVQQGLDMIKDYQDKNNFTYDCLVRARPDIMYEDSFKSELSPILDEICASDVIYIPKWHGRWEEISRTITDYFGIGNYKTMKKYMSVYDNLEELITKDIPHTGEGLLYGQIKDIEVKRFTSGFHVHRGTHIEKLV